MSLVGQLAPSFELKNQRDETISSNDFNGQPMVIFFYPKDNTSGCTKESDAFNALLPEFKALGVHVLGVSRDSVKSHQKFAEKLDLQYNLLADTEELLCQAYQVMVQKSMYGRQYMGIERSTFLIDGTGQVVTEWRKVKVDGHVAAVLEAAKAKIT